MDVALSIAVTVAVAVAVDVGFISFGVHLRMLNHRASASPGYGTQPLQCHRMQNRPKRCQKVPKCA